MALVFFYGTLMRGGANHIVLTRLAARFVAEATTKTARTLVDLGPYPALLPLSNKTRGADETCRVTGEVWEIGEQAFAELDAFEGCPDLYRRERIVLLRSEEELEAFVYVLVQPPPSRARIITTGRYTTPGLSLPDGASADQIDERDD